MEEKHTHIHNHNHEVSQDDELLALLNYMVGHNESHTSELSELAKQLDTDENAEAYNLVRKAIDEYKKGNELLKNALKQSETNPNR